MNQAISCNKLTKRYKTKLALNELTFSITENKIVGLIGRNGAGKTTFLKTCAGFIIPTSGELNILGEKPFDNLKVLSDVIFIDEEIQYNASLTLENILKLGSIHYENWDDTFARKLLKYFGLSLNQKYKKLSRGMKTQVNIIMGLCSRAPVTLMDEPTLGLDAAVRKEFYNILLKDYSEHPRTFIISSHLLSEIENLLEEIVLIKEGSLALHKSMEELQNYGIYLNGRSDILLPFIENKQVLNKEVFGNSLIAGIENNLTNDEIAYMKNNNVDISKIKVEDLCIYLTKNSKDGVFDGYETA